jgi:hypothetical protein
MGLRVRWLLGGRGLAGVGTLGSCERTRGDDVLDALVPAFETPKAGSSADAPALPALGAMAGGTRELWRTCVDGSREAAADTREAVEEPGVRPGRAQTTTTPTARAVTRAAAPPNQRDRHEPL